MKKKYLEKEETITLPKRKVNSPSPTSQYRDLKFKTDAEFQKWLKKMCKIKIDFVDTGRDMHRLWLADTGEVLHSNAQGSIWIGKFVKLEQIVVGIHVWMTLDNKWTEMKGLIVEQITKYK